MRTTGALALGHQPRRLFAMATVISHDYSPAGTGRQRVTPAASKVRRPGVIAAKEATEIRPTQP
jgi:hypothetical protein